MIRQTVKPSNQLSDLLTSSGISQRRLAFDAGLSPAAVNNLLHHGVWPRSPQHRRQLEDALRRALPYYDLPSTVNRQPSTVNQEIPMSLSPSDLAHFGLSKNPFSAARVNSAEDVLMTDEHVSAVQGIKEAAVHGEFRILIGPQGTGKTTAVDAAEEQLTRDDRFRFIRILNPQTDRLRYGPIIQAIGRNLGAAYNGFNYDRTLGEIKEIMIRKPDLRPLIILDDCHELATPTMKAVKRLWDNNKCGYRHIFGIVMVAQESINSRLGNLPEIGTHADLYNIWGLRNPNEVQAYISKKLKPLKAERLFDPAVADAIWNHLTRAIEKGLPWVAPRGLNNICCNLLQTAVQLGEPAVTSDIVDHYFTSSKS